MDLTIRTETPGDHDAIRAVNLAAFDNPAEAGLVEQMRETSERGDLISLVAELDGEIVGHALFSPARVENGDQIEMVMLLGPIAVTPAHQRCGIGSALMTQGILRVKERGYGLIVLIGHPEYYPRFGFVPARQHGLECPGNVSDPVFMVRELLPGSLGRIRGNLVYPAPFANLD